MDVVDLLIFAHAAINGYIDSITLIRYKVFAAVATGNIIFIGMGGSTELGALLSMMLAGNLRQFNPYVGPPVPPVKSLVGR